MKFRASSLFVSAAAAAVFSLLAHGAAVAADVKLSPQDTAAAFKAAGFKPKGKRWMKCDEGHIEEVRDLNGDGLPDVLITEGGTACFGMTGAGYSLVSKQATGGWKMLSSGTGIVTVLASKGAGGWPDLEIGGPAGLQHELVVGVVDADGHQRIVDQVVKRPGQPFNGLPPGFRTLTKITVVKAG